MFEQFWSIGIMLLPAIASYWSSFTVLYMAISYPTIILIFLYPLIPNSPRWLIQRGRVSEAKAVLLEAARINGKTDFSEADLEKQLQIQAAAVLEVPPDPSYWEMWRGQAKNLTAVHLCWAITVRKLTCIETEKGTKWTLSTQIVTYYGFLLNIRNFGRVRRLAILLNLGSLQFLIKNFRIIWKKTQSFAAFVRSSEHLSDFSWSWLRRKSGSTVQSSTSLLQSSRWLFILFQAAVGP